MGTLPLFQELADLPPCSVCRCPGFRRGCWRCEDRWRLFRPRSAAELEADAAAAAALRAEHDAAAELQSARFMRLRALGRPVRVCVVGCGKAKVRTPAPARELYVGSLFRGARRLAEELSDEWFIVSALHGLVEPTAQLDPYEFRLRSLSRVEKEGWGARVAGALEWRFRELPVALTVLAGGEYVRWLSRALPRTWSVSTPLAGLGLGARLQWLRLQRALSSQEVRHEAI